MNMFAWQRFIRSTHRQFDVVPRVDERDKQYPVHEILDRTVKPFDRAWECYVRLDQGTEGACTGFAVSIEAASQPTVVPNINNHVAFDLYHRAQKLDEFPGEDYSGSTVRAAMKAAVERGWYTEYRWAENVDDLISAVCQCGPAVLEIPWYSGMQFPSVFSGIVDPVGTLQGYHAICMPLWSETKQQAGLLNTWGRKWGKDGFCYLRKKDLADLLAGGKACIPIEREGNE